MFTKKNTSIESFNLTHALKVDGSNKNMGVSKVNNLEFLMTTYMDEFKFKKGRLDYGDEIQTFSSLIGSHVYAYHYIGGKLMQTCIIEIPDVINSLSEKTKSQIGLLIGLRSAKSLSKLSTLKVRIFPLNLEDVFILNIHNEKIEFGEMTSKGLLSFRSNLKSTIIDNSKSDISLPESILFSRGEIEIEGARFFRKRNYQRQIENEYIEKNFNEDDIPMNHFSPATRRYMQSILEDTQNNSIPHDNYDEPISIKYSKNKLTADVRGKVWTISDVDTNSELFLYSDASINNDRIGVGFSVVDQFGTIIQMGHAEIENIVTDAKIITNNEMELIAMLWGQSLSSHLEISKVLTDSTYAINHMENNIDINNGDYVWVKGHKQNSFNILVDKLAGMSPVESLSFKI